MKTLIKQISSGIKRQIRKQLIGDTVLSAFSTVTTPDDIRMKVYLGAGDVMEDVSSGHWLLCIDPIIYGIWIEKGKSHIPQTAGTAYHIYFTNPGNKTAQEIKRNAEAIQSLDYFNSIGEETGSLLLLKLNESTIRHLNPVKRYLIWRRYYKGAGPGYSFARFKSFVSAYSYPRRVRVISFREEDYYNIFPMDLLADVRQGNRFALGLRHGNATLSRIIETGKVVVSEAPHAQKKTIYKLGKHHGSGPPPLDELPFETVRTRHFGFYVPAWVESYKEISLRRTINLGSHMLLWGEVVAEERITAPVDHLYLVHLLHYLQHKNSGLAYPLI